MMQLDFSSLVGKKPSQLTGQDKVNFFRTLAAYLKEPTIPQFHLENAKRIQAWLVQQQIQGWTDKSDFPSGESFYPLLPAISAQPFYDEGFREFFNVMDFTNSQAGGFRQLLLTNTIDFELVPPGGKANIFNVTGSRTLIDFDKYGASLEWDKILLDDAEWVQIANIYAMFRNAAFQHYALFHYDLMNYVFDAANPLVKADIAWQLPEPAALPNTDPVYVANRDAQTINLACETIALHCANKGYAITPNSTFVVFNPLQLRGRIRRALGYTLQGYSSPPQLDYNIRQVTTMMLRVPTTRAAVTDHYIVAFPGARAQSGLRLSLEELNEENIQARSITQVDWMRYGAGIGDLDQIERCNIA